MPALVGFVTDRAGHQPAHVQHVPVDHSRDFTKGGGMWEATRPVLGYGLASSPSPPPRSSRGTECE